LRSFASREASHSGYEGLIAAESPGAHATLSAEPFKMGGGAVRNDLSTALAKLYREIFGRGPVNTTTYAFDAGYVTFLRDLLAPQERTLVLGRRSDLVCQARVAIREAERERLVAEVQRLTDRPVLYDSFQFQPERNLAIELFWIPTGSEDGAGSTPSPQAAAPSGARHRGVISDGER
jgi:uncharacterized protein YbcI